MVQTAQNILKKEGLPAFWHGHYLGQVHSIIAVSCQFQFYEFFTGVLNQNTRIYDNQHHGRIANFFCGIFGGCCSAAVVSPIEVIRVRQMMAAQQYKGLLNGAKQVYKNGGILAFYKGLSASLIQTGPTVGITFGVFATLQPLLIYYMTGCERGVCAGQSGREHVSSLIIASSVAASIASLLAKTITYPFDLSKRRLQMSGHKAKGGIQSPKTTAKIIKCRTLLECLFTSYRKDGFSGLFVGLTITLLRAQVTSIVAFTTYELICLGFRNKNLMTK